MTANHRPLEESDIELIERVQAAPCLYNTKDPFFRLVYKKDEEWQSIADSLYMTHWEVRKRWTVLRDRYARELKQLTLHPESTEYGKNDFFLRMDFIRNFVKKREVKRKRCNYRGKEAKNTSKVMPLKLYKVHGDVNSYESSDNQVFQQEKPYITDDSQYSSTGKFSYVEQMSPGTVDQEEQQEDNNTTFEESDNQEYHDYVDGSSIAYETVEGFHETTAHSECNNYELTSPFKESKNIIVKPEKAKASESFSITTVEEHISPLPQLQQRPFSTSTCAENTSSSSLIDTEEYFSRTIALYLRQLSHRHKIKAKIEMMQIIEKYIDLQESNS